MPNLLSLRISNLDQFTQSVRARATEASDLATPLSRSAILTQSTAVERINRGGDPQWLPSQRVLRSGGTTGILTGAMKNGIIPTAPVVVDGRGTVTVGVTGVAAKYASIFQRGSGSRGGRSDWTVVIRAKNARALSWVSGGKRYFARNVTQHHKGQVPRPFLYFDDPLIQKIRGIFADYLAGRA